MLNNKGFSFVEMLTVTIILCLIAIAAFPVIISLTDSSNEQIYNTNVDAIEKAAMTYATVHATELQDSKDDARFISLDDLEKLEFIKNADIVDPRTEEAMNGCVIIYLNDDNQYKTKYYEEDCNTTGSDYAPTIEVLKDSDSSYEVNSNIDYELPILSATTILEENIQIPKPKYECNSKEAEDLTEGKVSDICEIIYEVEDPNNKIVKTYVKEVEIVDTLDPVIIVNGQSKSFTMNILVDSDFSIIKPEIVDNSNEIKSSSIKSNLNIYIPGTYEVIYSATDIYDNVGILILTVNVVSDSLLEENQIIVDNARVLPGDGSLEKNQIGEYVFKGINPNNYIDYNNEMYRIIKLDTNGIKVIKNNELTKLVYNSKGTVNYSSSNLKEYHAEYQKLLVEEGLNKEFNFNAGTIDLNKMLPIDELLVKESNYTITSSFIGNINVSDYVLASSDNSCIQDITYCKNNNYLNFNNSYLTNHPATDISMTVINNGEISDKFVGEEVSIYPVIYLSDYKSLSGTGTSLDPYKLIF